MSFFKTFHEEVSPSEQHVSRSNWAPNLFSETGTWFRLPENHFHFLPILKFIGFRFFSIRFIYGTIKHINLVSINICTYLSTLWSRQFPQSKSDPCNPDKGIDEFSWQLLLQPLPPQDDGHSLKLFIYTFLELKSSLLLFYDMILSHENHILFWTFFMLFIM